MTRTRVLSLITGVAALAFSPLAMADDDPTMQPTGGDRYGAAQPTQQENLTPEEQPAPAAQPTEEMSPTGGDRYGAMPPEPVETPVVVEEPTEEHVWDGLGISIAVGGGVTDFIGDDARDVTDVGGSWDARVVLGTRSILGFEAAYVGTAQGMSALGLDDNAILTGNGFEALARLNLGTYTYQPYLVGGVGWTQYDIVNDNFNNSDIAGSDDVVTVPLGIGFDTRLGGGFLLDARFNYRPTFDENMFDFATANSNGSGDMSTWSATARIGFEF